MLRIAAFRVASDHSTFASAAITVRSHVAPKRERVSAIFWSVDGAKEVIRCENSQAKGAIQYPGKLEIVEALNREWLDSRASDKNKSNPAPDLLSVLHMLPSPWAR